MKGSAAADSRHPAGRSHPRGGRNIDSDFRRGCAARRRAAARRDRHDRGRARRGERDVRSSRSANSPGSDGHDISRRDCSAIFDHRSCVDRRRSIGRFRGGRIYCRRLTVSISDGLVQLVRGQVSPKQLGGPIKIAQVAGRRSVARRVAVRRACWRCSQLISDLSTCCQSPCWMEGIFSSMHEAVRRRPVSARALEWSFRGGLALILGLVVFTTVNDLGSLGLVGQASALDWLRGLGQGRNGSGGKRAAEQSTKGGDE